LRGAIDFFFQLFTRSQHSDDIVAQRDHTGARQRGEVYDGFRLNLEA
jgi:hypothetical protein